jgi:hypothetical protein
LITIQAKDTLTSHSRTSDAASVEQRAGALLKYGRLEDLAKDTDKPSVVLWAPRPRGRDHLADRPVSFSKQHP